MKKLKFFSIMIVVVFSCVLALGATARATTVEVPTVMLQAGEDTHMLEMRTLTSEETGKPIYVIESAQITTPDYEITVNAMLDPDPLIVYGISFMNMGNNPMNFFYSLMLPIATPALPHKVDSSLSYSMTDGTGNGLAVLPVGPNGFVQETYVDGGFVVGLDNAGAGLAPGVMSGIAGPFTVIGVDDGLGAVVRTSLAVTAAINLTGNFDTATLNGRSYLYPVPEPCALILLCCGLLGLIGLKRKNLF
jgi:hypothetical protein